MKKYKIFERISFSLLLIFALIGCIFMSVSIHEISHYKDFHPYIEDDYICIFIWPDNLGYFIDPQAQAGYYGYSYNHSDKNIMDNLDRVREHTETKAFIYSIIIIVTFFLVVAFQIIERLNTKNKTKLLDDLEKKLK